MAAPLIFPIKLYILLLIFLNVLAEAMPLRQYRRSTAPTSTKKSLQTILRVDFTLAVCTEHIVIPPGSK